MNENNILQNRLNDDNNKRTIDDISQNRIMVK